MMWCNSGTRGRSTKFDSSVLFGFSLHFPKSLGEESRSGFAVQVDIMRRLPSDSIDSRISESAKSICTVVMLSNSIDSRRAGLASRTLARYC